jgi:hypothetical protein
MRVLAVLRFAALRAALVSKRVAVSFWRQGLAAIAFLFF